MKILGPVSDSASDGGGDDGEDNDDDARSQEIRFEVKTCLLLPSLACPTPCGPLSHPRLKFEIVLWDHHWKMTTEKDLFPTCL